MMSLSSNLPRLGLIVVVVILFDVTIVVGAVQTQYGLAGRIVSSLQDERAKSVQALTHVMLLIQQW